MTRVATSGAPTTRATGGPTTTDEDGLVLSGPAGGSWSLVDGGAHGSPHYCQECGAFHQKAWCYSVGLVIRITLCEECVEGMVSA